MPGRGELCQKFRTLKYENIKVKYAAFILMVFMNLLQTKIYGSRYCILRLKNWLHVDENIRIRHVSIKLRHMTKELGMTPLQICVVAC